MHQGFVRVHQHITLYINALTSSSIHAPIHHSANAPLHSRINEYGDARARMIYLRNLLASYEIHVAHYYLTLSMKHQDEVL